MLTEDRRAAGCYLANMDAHPSNHRSKHSFSRLANRPSPSDLPSLLPPASSPPPANLKSMVGTWMPALRAGFNIMAHGFGSKVALLDGFVEEHCDEETLVLRAYQKKGDVLPELFEALSLISNVKGKTGSNLVSVAREMAWNLKGRSELLILVIHQIDAPHLRTEQAQESLSILANIPCIRLLCSCDNQHSSIFLSPAINFLYQDCTTFHRYGQEELGGVLEASGRTGKDGRATLASCKAVLKVLPSSAQRIYRVLAEHQLQYLLLQSTAITRVAGPEDSDDDDEDDDFLDDDGDMERQAKKGLSYHDWYNRCQQQLIISSEPAFRTQLAEFSDHHLVGGIESPSLAGLTYFIPFGKHELRLILDQLPV